MNALPRVLMTLAFVLIVGTARAFACPECFAAEETHLIDGAKLGVLVLLSVLLVVQGGFAGFFFYLRKRAKAMADVDLDDEWSEMQKVSRPS